MHAQPSAASDRNSHSHSLHILRLPGLLALILALAGCVAVQPQKKLTIEDLPYGQAAVFIAVSWPASSSSALELKFDDDHSVTLHSEAINRIYLPEGWYQMQLPNLDQQADNASMRYRFGAGDIYRFAVLKRYPVVGDSIKVLQTSAKPTYEITTSTRDAYDQLLIDEDLPVFDLDPGY